LLAVLLPALLFAGLALYGVLQSRAQVELRADQLAQNLASAVEGRVSANLEKIDLALSAVVDQLEQQLARGQLDKSAARATIQSQASRRAELEGIRVTDVHGVGILGPGLDHRTAANAVSFADREWFQVQRDNPNAGFHMSSPLVSKLNKEWIISFSRRYRTPDGQFAGAISAAVPLSYLAKHLQAVDLGPHGAVVLRDQHLKLITGHAPAAKRAPLVGSIEVPAELIAALSSSMANGNFHAVSPDDGLTRSGAYQRSAVAPLVVIVGLASKDYLADWRDSTLNVVAVVSIILLVYMAACGKLIHSAAQNRRSRQRIELLAKVFEHSGEAIMLTDRKHRVIEVNPAFVKQSGWLSEEMLGRDVGELAAPRAGTLANADITRLVAERGSWRGEIWARHKSGREFPIWVSVTEIRNAEREVTQHLYSSLDLSEIKQAQARILHLAQHDTLTELPNRSSLVSHLDHAMALARRDESELAMLVIDLDRFKNINDSLGHQVGDALLVEVGRRLRGLVRESDVVARLGGDEFVVVLNGVGQRGRDAAKSVAEKLLNELSRPYQVAGNELHTTPSIGISVFPADGDDTDTLLKNADTAMYQAKAAGRNNAQSFTPAMNQARGERLQLEAGLRTAVERHEFSLHYQPQVDLVSNRIVGMEALIRWRHPELGNIPPLKFIPVAEDIGLIESIGSWVLEEALSQVARWREDGHPTLRVAVNLSAQQLCVRDLPEQVALALKRHGLPGEALELEITESMAMQDPAHTAAMLKRLRDHGVAVAVDDFGTGYSSLAYLKQLPLSCLKLDRSFVMDIEKDANDAAICTATIQMAHSLGLGVVAEGVETGEQLDFLQRLGCDTVQGYFISKPMPAEACHAFLEQRDAVPA
jgi:diguanylate cyclase (GGDEF)-like protein/PAS domain S-box-containing protein